MSENVISITPIESVTISVHIREDNMYQLRLVSPWMKDFPIRSKWKSEQELDEDIRYLRNALNALLLDPQKELK